MVDIVIAALLAIGTSTAAPAPASPVTVKLLCDSGSIRLGQPVWVGVEFRMKPGWHIYWRNPGDSGMPTSIAWTLPSGFTVGEIQWPRPERMLEGTLVTYGYSGSVLLMARLTTPREMKSFTGLHLAASASWLACKDMCIPGKADVVLDLPAGDGQPGPNAGIFVRTRRLLPAPGVAPPGASAVPPGSPEPPGASPAGDEDLGLGFWGALLFAFLGGMILNLMPCVFPVLSIKVIGFVRESSHQPREVKVHGLLYGLGVVVSFWLLASGLILLRAGGERLGWGFQLQSPTVILGLAVIMFLLSLNLLGVFEAGTSIAHTTGKFTWTEGRAGAFFTGVLATFLATPCTAPFMGTALGYAMTRPVHEGLAVFTALGVGMAAPYMGLSFAPHLSRYLPRPGRWMETFKQVMAFPLLVTVIWLLWVLGLQAGLAAVITALGCLLVSGVAGWLYGRWHTRFMRVVVVLLIAGGVLATVASMRNAAPMGAPAAAGEWEPYTQSRLDAALAKGDPVFVDFTAAWCLTCKVNEMTALNVRDVMEAFRRHRVVLLKADWTNPNPDIERALAASGRTGVPLYLLYTGGRGSAPKVLPQILTARKVLAELDALPARN